MLDQLSQLLPSKNYVVLDFDRTLAKMEIDWSGWFAGMSAIFDQYDASHGFAPGKNPHVYHNQMVAKFGDQLLNQIKIFNQEYERTHLTGLTPNTALIEFVQAHPEPTYYVYSSNSRPTVVDGLKQLQIADLFQTVVSKDDVNFVKPDPEGFNLFAGYAESPELFVMVGDSGADRGAAASAGVDFVECNVFEKYEEEA